MILLPFFLQVYRVFGLEIQFFTFIFDTQENSYTIFYPKGMMIMIYTDTHLHTSFSSDSDTPMELMIKKGLELGMKTLCFTEHYDPCYPDTPDKLDFLLDFENYKKTLFSLKEKYASQIEILYGLELGVQPHLGRLLANFYEKYGKDFDFIINSCHIVNNMDPYYGTYFKELGATRGLMTYFETVLSNLKAFPHYQSVGHLDYVCRYLPESSQTFFYDHFSDILDEILIEIIERNRALEVNTAGLKYGLGWPNPDISILRRYRELGGELITIGSDAHKPEHMAWEFDKVPDILHRAGFRHYVVFKEKKPVVYDI